MKHYATFAFAAAALAAALPAAAQDLSARPTYEAVTLNSGFANDPYNVSVQSGGSIDSSGIGSPCTGFIASAPDVRLNYQSGSLPLYLSTTSDADTTLIVNAPDGQWYCDDDTGEGLNPLVVFAKPQSGQYDIWIGTYASADFRAATLHISELSGY
ncbi:MAG: hypothetical protein ABIT10_05670 [Alteraurantiacibacter sp.]